MPDTKITAPRDVWDDVTVLIVTYNSAGVIGDCLRSLAQAKHVIIVDNASRDDTLDIVENLGIASRIVRNDENLGFGRANNQGFGLVETEFALMINPDTKFDHQAVEALVARARAEENALIVGPLLTDVAGNLELPVMGPQERNHHALGLAPSGPFATWFLTAAAWLCRMPLWRELGGFDEEIFLYNEDADLCLRATAAGYRLVLEPQAKVTHLRGRSAPANAHVRDLKDWHQTWGHLYLEGKHSNLRAARREARSIRLRRSLKALLYLILMRPSRYRGNRIKAEAAHAFLSDKGSWFR